MILHGILSTNESVTVLTDLIMESKIESFDRGFVKEIVRDIKSANDEEDILVNIRCFYCPHCPEFYATKQPLSKHIGEKHPSPEMQRRLDNHAT